MAMTTINISERIKDLRRKAKLTKAELARHLKLNKSTVTLWEQGKRFPTTRHALALMMLLWQTTQEEVDYVYYKRDEKRSSWL